MYVKKIILNKPKSSLYKLLNNNSNAIRSTNNFNWNYLHYLHYYSGGRERCNLFCYHNHPQHLLLSKGNYVTTRIREFTSCLIRHLSCDNQLPNMLTLLSHRTHYILTKPPSRYSFLVLVKSNISTYIVYNQESNTRRKHMKNFTFITYSHNAFIAPIFQQRIKDILEYHTDRSCPLPLFHNQTIK